MARKATAKQAISSREARRPAWSTLRRGGAAGGPADQLGPSDGDGPGIGIGSDRVPFDIDPAAAAAAGAAGPPPAEREAEAEAEPSPAIRSVGERWAVVELAPNRQVQVDTLLVQVVCIRGSAKPGVQKTQQGIETYSGAKADADGVTELVIAPRAPVPASIVKLQLRPGHTYHAASSAIVAMDGTVRRSSVDNALLPLKLELNEGDTGCVYLLGAGGICRVGGGSRVITQRGSLLAGPSSASVSTAANADQVQLDCTRCDDAVYLQAEPAAASASASAFDGTPAASAAAEGAGPKKAGGGGGGGGGGRGSGRSGGRGGGRGGAAAKRAAR